MGKVLRKEDAALSQRLGNLTCVVKTATLWELSNEGVTCLHSDQVFFKS